VAFLNNPENSKSKETNMNDREGGQIQATLFHSRLRLDDEIEITREERIAMIEQALAELERDGLIYDTGRRRNGQIVYALIPSSSEIN
jgi:hypothetical protein